MASTLVSILILGLLIMVHEAGHFVVARWVGVRVLRFSIGFGPRLLTWTRGHTEYAISAIPLGGYVKMAGEQRSEQANEPWEYLSKPVGTRMGIVFAGPFVNYLVAILTLWIVFVVGFPEASPTVGRRLASIPPQAILSQSIEEQFGATAGKAAEAAGRITTLLQTAGDAERLDAVLRDAGIHASEPQISDFIEDVLVRPVAAHKAAALSRLIEKEFDATAQRALEAATKISALGEQAADPELLGRAFQQAHVPLTESQLDGFIASVIYPPVFLRPHGALTASIQEHFDATAGEAAEAAGQIEHLAEATHDPQLVGAAFLGAGISLSQKQVSAFITEVLDTPAQAAGLEMGDRIVAIDEQPVATWDEMTTIIRASGETPLRVRIAREGVERTITVVPETKEITDLFGRPKTVGQIGIAPSGEVTATPMGPVEAIGRTFAQHAEWCTMMGEAFASIVARRKSMKEMFAGPIAIVVITSEAVYLGFVTVLYLVSLFSLSLAIFNVLPIPILDGGHLFFLLLEKLRGTPVSLNVQERASQVSLVLLVTLIVVVCVNDIQRFKLFERLLDWVR